MTWVERAYPVGKEIKSYPSPAGDFPATVIGYGRHHNLNTWEQHPMVRVRVRCKDEDGREFFTIEDFDPQLLQPEDDNDTASG